MLSILREALSMPRRTDSCRRDGHTWTEMANPPACAACGRTRPATVAAPERAAA